MARPVPLLGPLLLALIVVAAGTAESADKASPSARDTSSGRCIADWSVAALIVRKEGLVTVEQLLRKAHGIIQGTILKTELCLDDGRYSYRLVIREVQGRLRAMTVDARQPFER